MGSPRPIQNTVNDIKNHDIKTIYFNCFDTWLEINVPYVGLWAMPLIETLNVAPKAVRDFVLLQNKDLREILLEEMPYIENNPQKMEAIALAEQAIQEEIESIRLKPGAAAALPELQARGYKIGLISNIAKAYIPKVQELTPITFYHMLFSCELGQKKTKNNSDIYRTAHMRTEHKKREIVMIGDHPVNDYDAADTYGFSPIHMDWKQKNEKPHRIHTLEALLDLFPDKKIEHA